MMMWNAEFHQEKKENCEIGPVKLPVEIDHRAYFIH